MATVTTKADTGFRLHSIAPKSYAKIRRELPNVELDYDRDNFSLLFPSNLLENVTWDAYETILDSVEHGRFRHTYEEGTLEMMSPLYGHETKRKLIARCLETMSIEFDIPIVSFGSTTQKKKKLRRGLEPDESYYVQNERRMWQRQNYDPDRDPPPDLAIEVDHTSSSKPRLPIYSRLGIPEVWRHDGRILQFLHRTATGKYEPRPQSAAFPFLSPDDLTAVLTLHGKQSENAIITEFLRLVRARLRKHASSKVKRNAKD